MIRPVAAGFRRYGLAEKSLLDARAPGGPVGHRGAKNPIFGPKNGRGGRWRRYRRAVCMEKSCGPSVRTPWRRFRTVLSGRARCATIVINFGAIVLKILAKTAQNGPFLAFLGGFLRLGGSQWAEKLVTCSLYLYTVRPFVILSPHGGERIFPGACFALLCFACCD